jgi:hypothetical protein
MKIIEVVRVAHGIVYFQKEQRVLIVLTHNTLFLIDLGFDSNKRLEIQTDVSLFAVLPLNKISLRAEKHTLVISLEDFPDDPIRFHEQSQSKWGRAISFLEATRDLNLQEDMSPIKVCDHVAVSDTESTVELPSLVAEFITKNVSSPLRIPRRDIPKSTKQKELEHKLENGNSFQLFTHHTGMCPSYAC